MGNAADGERARGDALGAAGAAGEQDRREGGDGRAVGVRKGGPG